MDNNVKVGLLGVGLKAYWGQFDGLFLRLVGFQKEISKRLANSGAEVVDVGLIDSPERASSAARELQAADIEIVFVSILTYSLSSTILPIVRDLNKTVVLLNIQSVSSIDYETFSRLPDRNSMTREWLAHCQACSLPEFACIFNRAEIRYDIVSGYLDEKYVWRKIQDWIDAAYVVRNMRENRLGILGHYYCGMLDVYTDITLQSSVFGTHIEMLEMCELKTYRDKVTRDELQAKRREFESVFDISSACSEEELCRAAYTSVALDKLVEKHNLGALAYYYEGYSGNDYENIITSVIAGNTLLSGKGIPVAGECEVKNVQAMKIMSLLGCGGSFSEPYAMDFDDDVVLWGHDGPAHFTIADGPVKLVPLQVYHGKPGNGLSIQMTVRQGKVTFLSVCENKDGIFLLVAQGESVEGPTLQIGNTNSRYRFACGARDFMDNWSKAGPSHHCAIGVGHVADKIDKIAKLLHIPCVRIC